MSRKKMEGWHWKKTSMDMYGKFNAEALVSPAGREVLVAGQCQWEGQLICEPKDAVLLLEALNAFNKKSRGSK